MFLSKSPATHQTHPTEINLAQTHSVI